MQTLPRRQQGAWIAIGLILLIVFSRLIPHPPNFTPVLAAALFCGTLYMRPSHSLLVPLLGMAAGDLVLGFHDQVWAVYLAVALCVGLGRWMLSPPAVLATLGAGVSGSALFFLLTNFAVWLQGDFYPMTTAGLLACYVAAIPFFHHTLIATLLFGLALFGLSRLFQNGQPSGGLLPTQHY
ncbi:MAG: hypothetical protein OXH88_07135 [Gammaproteobacteria bacterium]|nr:hypothetical protein [Gammaproteobacteria bacterium]